MVQVGAEESITQQASSLSKYALLGAVVRRLENPVCGSSKARGAGAPGGWGGHLL